MLRAVGKAAAAFGQSPISLIEAYRSSSVVCVKLYRADTSKGFVTSSAAFAPTTAREVSEEEIANIRQRVFGTHIGNGLPSGRKILRKKLVGEKIAAYYDHARPIKDPLIVDLKAEQ